MRIYRLLGLLSVLAEVEHITVQELAVRFEVSRRTILRDIDTLNEAGFPVASRPGRGGGVSILKGYRQDKRLLSREDIASLFTALDGLKGLVGDGSVSALLARLVPVPETDARSRSRYLLDYTPWFTDSITWKKLSELHRAICSRMVCKMDYVSKTGRRTRLVEPHKLVFKQSDWYLYAFCRERSAFRLFKLRRIVSCVPYGERFSTRQMDETTFEQRFGGGGLSAVKKDGYYQIVLGYERRDAFTLTEKIDACLLDAPGGGSDTGRICFYAPELSFARELVMGLLGKVRVVAPPELREELRDELKKINDFYKR